jgi:hypothetical protein
VRAASGRGKASSRVRRVSALQGVAQRLVRLQLLLSTPLVCKGVRDPTEAVAESRAARAASQSEVAQG